MISTFWNAQPVWLLDLQPDYATPITSDVSLVAIADAGLTNRESRRAFGKTLRFRTKFKILAHGADARRLAGGLRVYQNEPVFLPLWPAAVPWSQYGTRVIGGGINLVFKEDWSQWALFVPIGGEPVWAQPNDIVVPVSQGRLEGRAVSWLGADLVEFDVDHSEASPASAAITVAPSAWAAGPSPSVAYAAAPYLFPFELNAAGAVGQESLITILREEVGFTRQPAETLYSQAVARRDQSSHFTASQAQWASMLRFFLEHGSGKVFWAADWKSAVELAADVAAADTTLTAADTQGILVGDWLAFLSSAGGPGGVTATARVQGVPDATRVNLVLPGLAGAGAAVPPVMTKGDTLVSYLLLVRFDAPKITLQWHSNDNAAVVLKLLELPPEYAPAADETLGTTIGSLPVRCYLYEFSRLLDGLTWTERVTSFENDLTYGGNNYTSRRISHGDIRFTLQADQTQVEVKDDLVAGSTMVLLATLQMEAPLMLVIRSADTDGVNATNSVVLFSGEVEMASVVGNRITAKASCAGARFDRKIPRFVLQMGCNYALFSVGCTLAAATLRCTAQMRNPGAPGYPYTFILQNLLPAIPAGPAGAYGADWFSGGWIEFGAGLTKQRRGIIVSTVPAAGVLTVTLDRDPAPYPLVGDQCILYPGCDGQAFTCVSKFNNYLNFGGHPYLPASNPSLIQQQVNGGKK